MTANIAGPDGRRTLPVEVTAGPGKTNLKKGEFIVSFNLPAKKRLTEVTLPTLNTTNRNGHSVVGCGGD